jgi:hypothetical protein
MGPLGAFELQKSIRVAHKIIFLVTKATSKTQIIMNAQPTKKKVQWYPTYTAKRIGIPDDDEKKNIWYQKQDFKQFREDCERIMGLVREVGAKTVEMSNTCSCKGLEHLFSKKRAQLRLDRRRQAWDAVLEEQEEQRRRPISRSDIIAERYGQISLYCQINANKLA